MGIQRFVRNKLNYLDAKKDYKFDMQKYKNMQSGDEFILDEKNNYPIYFDKYKQAGNLDSHYFLQDIYMARKVIDSNPNHHFDIGSRVEGFISHLLASGKIDVVTLLDIRPLSIEISGLEFIQTDATSLENIPDNSIASLSSLHAIEHFGLGRYGDEIDPDAWKKALLSMQRKIAPGGRLFLAVPVGTTEKVCFNAHRIFSPSTIRDTLSELNLISFAYIHQYKIVESSFEDFQKNGGEYDCGLFVFQKGNV